MHAALRDRPRGADADAALQEARLRGGAAWRALRGSRVGPPVAVRRWPWAVAAAVTGAATGVAVVLVLARLRTRDAPGALEPEELRAVIDRPHLDADSAIETLSDLST